MATVHLSQLKLGTKDGHQDDTTNICKVGEAELKVAISCQNDVWEVSNILPDTMGNEHSTDEGCGIGVDVLLLTSGHEESNDCCNHEDGQFDPS